MSVAPAHATPRYDADRVWRDFPILAREVHGRPLVFLDSAASSQRPLAVIHAVDEYEKRHHANVHRGVHLLSQEATAMFEHAREVFVESVREHRDSAEALAALGYTLHRLSDETGARRELRSALELDAELYEARIYLAHLLYDAGDWGAALREFERVPLTEQWDSLAIWRVIELKRAIGVSEPLSLYVDTHGTGKVDDAKLEAAVAKVAGEALGGLTPRGIREGLGLNKPIYRRSAAYGHFGRKANGDFFPWEKTDLADKLKAALG